MNWAILFIEKIGISSIFVNQVYYLTGCNVVFYLIVVIIFRILLFLEYTLVLGSSPIIDLFRVNVILHGKLKHKNCLNDTYP